MLDEYKPMMDALNDAGGQLTELLDGPAVSQVGDLMTSDNTSYQTVTDVVQKRSDSIKMQRHKSLEVCVPPQCFLLQHKPEEHSLELNILTPPTLT